MTADYFCVHHKNNIFALVFSSNAKRIHTDQSLLQTFVLSLKATVLLTFKGAAAKTCFPSVYIIDTSCFDECFLFHVTTERPCF